MDPHEEIINWLNSPDQDFDKGYNIFVRLTHNRALVQFLSRTKRFSKLKYELEKLAEKKSLKNITAPDPVKPKEPEAVQKVRKAIISEGEKVQVVHEGKVNYEDLPEELKKVYDENTSLYKTMRAMHEQLKIAVTDTERALKRKAIGELDDSIAANWKRIDDWATGKTEKPVEGEVYKQINAARTYLSRNISKIETLTGDKREKLKADLTNRIEFLKANKAEISKETLVKLAKNGITPNN